MSTNEDTILSQYVPGFRANLNLAPQQTDTKLLSAVDGDLAYDTPGEMFNADDVQATDPEDVNTRVADTPDKFLAFTRRVGFFQAFHDAAWLDNVDKARELEDPTNKTMAAIMAGRWRKVDKTIIAGLLGPAYGKTDDVSAPAQISAAPSTVVAAGDVTLKHQDEIVPDDGSGYGLSVGKIIRAGLVLDDSQLTGERYFVAGPAQKADLLQRTPVTSQFFAAVKALVAGEIDNFLGFNFIWLPRVQLPTVNNDGVTRRCAAWIKDAGVYRGRPITNARIAIRNDKSDTPQAFYKTEHGFVRRYDGAVCEVDCTESV